VDMTGWSEERASQYLSRDMQHIQYNKQRRRRNAARLSRDECINTCRLQGYKYAGLAWKTQCFCDNQFGNSKHSEKRPDGECNTPCEVGDTNVFCGGGWRMQHAL
jgi:hypothetical protein